MDKNDVKLVLEFLSNEENAESILLKVGEEALKIYKNFGYCNLLDMYSSLKEEYKDKMTEVISNELKIL